MSTWLKAAQLITTRGRSARSTRSVCGASPRVSWERLRPAARRPSVERNACPSWPWAPRTRNSGRLTAKERFFHRLAEAVADEDVALLNARRLAAGHRQQDVGRIAQLAAAFAGERDRRQAQLARLLQRGHHVRRVARGREADRHIAR